MGSTAERTKKKKEKEQKKGNLTLLRKNLKRNDKANCTKSDSIYIPLGFI
jgi:hypothetical protein